MDYPHSLERYQRPVLLIGIAALGVCAVGGFFAPAQFFRSYLFAFLFWAGVALGCMPTFQGLISEEGLLQLVAYVKSLSKAAPSPEGVAPPVQNSPPRSEAKK